LLFGFVYQRCFVKARGWELLPNFHFWKEVGNLQAVSGAADVMTAAAVSPTATVVLRSCHFSADRVLLSDASS